MSSWAKPGVKCVCLDDRWEGASPLKKGATYTIHAITLGEGRHPGVKVTRGMGLLLVEAENPHQPSVGFSAARFRPLITRTQEQDLELFRHHLSGNSLSEPA